MVSKSPSSKRGSAGASTNQLIYPTSGTMKFYARMEFYEYNRNIDTDASRRQTAVIILPVPTSITDNAGFSISSNNLGMFQNIANGYKIGSGIATGETDTGAMMDSATAAFKAAKQDPLKAAAVIAALTPGVSDLSIGNFAEVQAGIVRNPHTTAAFNGVGLKTYNFEWRVSPRSEEEGERLLQILNTIRQRSHPDFNQTVGSYALDYPDLVKVTFVNTKGLPEVDFSFVENFSVSSFPQGPAFFKDGLPVETGFSIQLRETDIRTRKNYE